MESVDSFEDFLKVKKQSGTNIDWEERKLKWLKSIEDFYAQIESWLSAYKEKGLISFDDNISVEITEEFIGKYQAKKFDIYIGDYIVTLKPIATNIVGGVGRIDMRGSSGEIKIIQFDWGKWFFIHKSPNLEKWPVTKESFEKILQDIS